MYECFGFLCVHGLCDDCGSALRSVHCRLPVLSSHRFGSLARLHEFFRLVVAENCWNLTGWRFKKKEFCDLRKLPRILHAYFVSGTFFYLLWLQQFWKPNNHWKNFCGPLRIFWAQLQLTPCFILALLMTSNMISLTPFQNTTPLSQCWGKYVSETNAQLFAMLSIF